jgi:hypothetical protein
MSVGDNFTLLPLSKYFVKKSDVQPGPQTNLGLTQPIASGFIQVDAINITGNPVGMYTWYRLSQFTGSPNTQGAELREYLLVFRDVSSNTNNVSFDIPIPEGGFNANYNSVKLLYTIQTSLLQTLELAQIQYGAFPSIPHFLMFIFLLKQV